MGILLVLDRCISYTLDYFYSQTKTGQTGGKINYYLSLQLTPQWVVMGNSRALYQINPDSFKLPTYNLCHAGMHQIFQTGLLDVMATQGKMPRVILLHLEPEEFMGEQFDYDIQNLKYYHSKNEWITNQLNALSQFEKIKFQLRCYRYNGRIVSLAKNLVQTKRSNYKDNGYVAIAPSELDSITTIYSLKNNEIETRAEINNLQISYLKRFLEICHKHNTKVICFTSPIYKYNTTKTSGILKLEAFLQKNNVPYINFLDREIPELQRKVSLWKDRHHLNELGARIESSVLATELEAIFEKVQ